MTASTQRLASLGLCLLLGACAEPAKQPDLIELYRAAAEIKGPERRPLVTIPGTLGSRLVDRQSGETIWGGLDGISVDPDTETGLRQLALPIDQDLPLVDLRDEVEPDSVLKTARTRVLGLPFELPVYSGILNTIGAGGYGRRRPISGETPQNASPAFARDSFEFSYDWRRDIVESARRLEQFLRAQKVGIDAARVARYGPQVNRVKFDIVAHSMGALITRYFLMYGGAEPPPPGVDPAPNWSGADLVERVILIAPPNAGSALAFENLVGGKDLGYLQPNFPPALLGTFPSTYQLLPRPRHRRILWAGSGGEPIGDFYDAALWRRIGWGLSDPGQSAVLEMLMPDVPEPAERLRLAKVFQERALDRAHATHRALDVETDPPDGLDIYLVVGGGFQTPATVTADPDTGEVVIAELEEGDGVVLRASALLDERQGAQFGLGLNSPISYRSVLFLPEEHLDLTSSAVLGDNLLFWLLEDAGRDKSLRQPSFEGVSAGPPTEEPIFLGAEPDR